MCTAPAVSVRINVDLPQMPTISAHFVSVGAPSFFGGRALFMCCCVVEVKCWCVVVVVRAVVKVVWCSLIFLCFDFHCYGRIC